MQLNTFKKRLSSYFHTVYSRYFIMAYHKHINSYEIDCSACVLNIQLINTDKECCVITYFQSHKENTPKLIEGEYRYELLLQILMHYQQQNYKEISEYFE